MPPLLRAAAGPAHDDAVPVRHLVGATALYSGIGVWLLILLDRMAGLPFDLPHAWYRHRALCGALGGALFVMGWFLQRNRRTEPAAWRPAAPGKRFERLVVYSRADCHLCDDAKATLAEYLEYLPELEVVDIDADPELQARFGATVPVVELDGREHFRGRIDEALLRRLIDATPPADRR